MTRYESFLMSAKSQTSPTCPVNVLKQCCTRKSQNLTSVSLLEDTSTCSLGSERKAKLVTGPLWPLSLKSKYVVQFLRHFSEWTLPISLSQDYRLSRCGCSGIIGRAHCKNSSIYDECQAQSSNVFDLPRDWAHQDDLYKYILAAHPWISTDIILLVK